MEELDLIDKAKEGNKKAFEELYKLYCKRIYRYCLINIARNDLAQDLCQETFIKAWKAIPTFTIKDGGTFQAFLFRIARNLLIDLSRKKKEFSLQTYQEIEIDEQLEEHVDREQSIERLKVALAKLNDIDRQIIILRYFEEMSHADAAQVIGIKDSALRVRTHRILQKLKGLLTNDE